MATTFEKTWAFDLNRAYTPANALDLTRYTMWLLASYLTGNTGGLTSGKWTLYASSDSATAGTDSTDRWKLTTAYDGTKIVRGSGSNIHSWIVLSSPTMNGSTWYVTISFNSANDKSMRFYLSKDAPAGGSTTATPMPAQATRISTGSTSGVISDNVINAGTTDNSRFNFALASDGSWYFIGCKQGAGVANLLFMCHAAANYSTGDKAPMLVAFEYTPAGICRVGAGAGASCLFKTGTTINLGFDMAGPGPLPIVAIRPATGVTAGAFSGSTADIDGYHPDFPMWFTQTTASSTTVRGFRYRIPDLAISGSSTDGTPAESTTSPSGGPVDSVKIGNIWWPATAAFTL